MHGVFQILSLKNLNFLDKKAKKKASNFEKKICIRNIVKIALKTKLLG